MPAIKILCFDVETTGTHPYLHGIHQLSGQIIIDGKVKEKFDFLMCPYEDCEYDKEALRVCDTTKAIIKKREREALVYTKFMKLLRKYIDVSNPKDKYFLMGYFNLHMDNDFLNLFMQRNAIRNNPYMAYFYPGALDVSVLALERMKYDRNRMQDFKLATVAKHLGIKVNEAHLHEAWYDVYLTYEIYLKCIEFKTPYIFYDTDNAGNK